MTTASSTPRDESARPGEGWAELISFPGPPSTQTAQREASSSWPGQLIDLEQARKLAGFAEEPADSRSANTPEVDEAPGTARADQHAAARHIALRSLAARARSEYEVRQKLADRGVEPDVVAGVVSSLQSEGLLDDAELAQDLATTLWERKRMGPTAIRHSLMKRHIDRRFIDQAVEGLGSIGDEELLELARSRMRSLRGLDRQVQYRRLTGYFARRGFSGSEVSRVVTRVLNSDS